MTERERWLLSQYRWHQKQAEHYHQLLLVEEANNRISKPLFKNSQRKGRDEPGQSSEGT